MRLRPPAAEAALGVAAMLLFVAYFGVHCFRYPPPPLGDLGRHCAAVASLYRSFLHPLQFWTSTGSSRSGRIAGDARRSCGGIA